MPPDVSEAPSAATIWDDELEQLAEKVRLVFGEAAVFEATVRAVHMTRSIIDGPTRCPADDVTHLGAVTVVDAILSLKTELRRLLTVH
jgi:hypothetical protein